MPIFPITVPATHFAPEPDSTVIALYCSTPCNTRWSHFRTQAELHTARHPVVAGEASHVSCTAFTLRSPRLERGPTAKRGRGDLGDVGHGFDSDGDLDELVPCCGDRTSVGDRHGRRPRILARVDFIVDLDDLPPIDWITGFLRLPAVEFLRQLKNPRSESGSPWVVDIARDAAKEEAVTVALCTSQGTCELVRVNGSAAGDVKEAVVKAVHGLAKAVVACAVLVNNSRDGEHIRMALSGASPSISWNSGYGAICQA